VERAVLVGHDLGGGVVQIAAVREPRRCAGLVLINSIAYDSWPIPSVRALRTAAPVTARLPMPAFRALVGSLLARGHDEPAIARESLAVHLEPYRRHGGAAALAWQVRWLRTADTLAVADRLRDLGCPRGWCGVLPTGSRSCRTGSGWRGTCAPSCGPSRAAGTLSPRTTPRGSPPPSTRSSRPPAAGAALPAGLRRAAQRGGGDTAPTPLQYLLFGAST
jgi:hypothetical protein